MKIWRAVVLCVVMAACGSPHREAVVEKPKSPPPAPATPVAIAFVMEGWEGWVGNDEIPNLPEGEVHLGALKGLEEAFAKVSLASLPAGSTATVVSYGERAVVRHPMGPAATLKASAFGAQKDYLGVIDRDLVGGLTLGLDELAKVKDARRVLVVIGDGTDSNADTAKERLTALARRAEAEKVQIVSYVYKAELSSESTPLGAFDPNMQQISTLETITNALEVLSDRIAPQPVVAPTGSSVALALLLGGGEIWMGNDDIEPADSPGRYLGALKPIRAAFARAPLSGLPAGSQGLVLAYDDRVQTKKPLGPIEKLDAEAVGDQRSYYKRFGSELVVGARAAISQLGKIPAGRRVLVVIGDGNDTNNETAKVQLAQLAKEAAAQHVEVHAIIYKGPLSSDESVVQALAPDATTAKTGDDLTAQLVALFTTLRKK